jgi:hypothetical protein
MRRRERGVRTLLMYSRRGRTVERTARPPSSYLCVRPVSRDMAPPTRGKKISMRKRMEKDEKEKRTLRKA